MKELTNEELVKLDGGGLSVWAIIGIAALVVFTIGIFDGYTRPLSCNK